MTPIHRKLIPTALGHVHTITKAGSGRPLLLLHMSPKSSRMYRPVMDRLDRPVAAIDRPGFGASDTPLEPPTIADYAAASLAVVDELGWTTFDVVGTHTGSVEAVELARTAPDRVGTVGIVSIPAYGPDDVEDRLRGVAAPRPAPTADGDHLRQAWRQRISIRSKPHDLMHLTNLFIDSVLSMPKVHWAYRAVLEYPMLERLQEIPHLVVFAPHDDLTELTDRARTSLPPHTRFIELAHLDFDLWETAPDEMAHLLDTEIPADSTLDGRGTDC